MKNNMEAILRIINSDPELKAKFETTVDNYCNSREWQLVLAWVTKRHNLTGDQMEALTFALEWADSHTNWISVEDELPKKGDAILAMQDIQGNHWFTACQFIKADVCRGIVDFFVKSDAHIGISVDGKVTLGHVSHWMPRPAPPEHLAGVSKMISSSELPNNRKGGKQ